MSYSLNPSVLFYLYAPPNSYPVTKLTIYDEDGNFVVSKSNPPQAGMLSEFLGIDLPTKPGETEFRGTLVLEALNGEKIAPTVLRANWPSLTLIPARAEK